MSQQEYTMELYDHYHPEERAEYMSMPRREDISEREKRRLEKQARNFGLIDKYILSHGRAGARVCLSFLYRTDPAMQEAIKLYFDNIRSPS